MKIVKIIMLLSVLNTISCSTMAVNLTPLEIVDGVARFDSVARDAVANPPVGQDLQDFLEANADAWNTIAEWYGLK